MNLKGVTSIFALILTCASAAPAQEATCTLKLAQVVQAPELRGLRPGMTVAQVKSRVPTLELGPVDEFGLASTSFSPDFQPGFDKSTFAGVRTVSLEFLDGRLASLWIGYSGSFKWQGLDEFVRGMSAALGLPGAWRSKSLERQLECHDFQVAARMIGGSSSLRLTDEAAKRVWEQRRALKEETQP